MGLENLRSVFQEELNNSIEQFSTNTIVDVNDTKFTQFPTTQLNQLIGQSPLDGMSWESLYESNHSPKDSPSHKGLVPINYPNVSRDNLNIRNPEDGRFGFGGSLRTSAISAVGKLIGQVPFLEGDVTEFLKDTGKEPYIVSPIPKTQSDLFSGRTINFGSRDFPIARSLTDTIRLTKYLTSPSGLIFIEKQKILRGDFPSPLNKLGLKDFQGQKYKSGYNPISTLISTFGRAGGGPIGLVDRTQPSLSGLLSFLDVGIELDSYPDFNIFDENASTMKQRGDDFTDEFLGSLTDNLITTDRSPKNENVEEVQPAGLQSLNNTFRPINVESDSGFGGDKHTLLDFGVTDDEITERLGRTQYKDTLDEAHPTDSKNGTIEGEQNGMPFYFKDMRDGAYVFFRAFIEGLSENISPNYNPTQYIGRSEPVYTYGQTERDINFTLKLFAQTKTELSSIYEKMNALTSLCYPQYLEDTFETGEVNANNEPIKRSYGNRMKPPLTKLRMGELYGNRRNELMGYIKSISYAVDQTSPYEVDSEKRVPMHIIATIGYQVIHSSVPNLETQFYGYIGD